MSSSTRTLHAHNTNHSDIISLEGLIYNLFVNCLLKTQVFDINLSLWMLSQELVNFFLKVFLAFRSIFTDSDILNVRGIGEMISFWWFPLVLQVADSYIDQVARRVQASVSNTDLLIDCHQSFRSWLQELLWALAKLVGYLACLAVVNCWHNRNFGSSNIDFANIIGLASALGMEDSVTKLNKCPISVFSYVENAYREFKKVRIF